MKGNLILPKWERLAKVLVPELYATFRCDAAYNDRYDGSVMPFMSQLLQATTAAHRENDEQFLVNAYAFAHWCVTQHERDLWNSAGVSFFQRVFDDLPADEVVPWISADVFAEISPLLEVRFGAERARKIRKRFEARRETVERNYPSVIARAEREMSKAS